MCIERNTLILGLFPLAFPLPSWKIDNAENFAKARALRANKGWKQYWQAIELAA